MKITAAILTGGRSSRMNGQDKKLLEINGRSVIAHIAQVLEGIFGEVILVGQDVSELNYPVFPDLYPDTGPLSGVLTALESAESTHVFITSCDTPFFSGAFASVMKSNFMEHPCDILVPEHHGGIEPLYGIYSVSLTTKAEALIHSGNFRIRSLFQDSDTCYMNADAGSPETIFFNINTPADLLQAEAYAKKHNLYGY